MNKKYGWTEKGIVGMIFIPLGLIFLIVGAVVAGIGAIEPDERTAFLICFAGGGTVFFLIGLLLLFLDLRRRRLQREAYESGYCVMGKVAGTRPITRVNMMGTHPRVVEVHYTDPDTGTVHVYDSRYLYIHVDDLLSRDEVPVYLNRNDYRIGFVDIDAVMPKVEVHRL